jgi:hypothetical protein
MLSLSPYLTAVDVMAVKEQQHSSNNTPTSLFGT